MKLQDDGAGKKLYCLFLEREIKEFGPKDVQMEVAPPSGAVIEGKNPEKKETCGSQGWCPGGKISQAKVECEDKGGGGAGKVDHEPKRIQKDPSFHTGRSTLRPVEYWRWGVSQTTAWKTDKITDLTFFPNLSVYPMLCFTTLNSSKTNPPLDIDVWIPKFTFKEKYQAQSGFKNNRLLSLHSSTIKATNPQDIAGEGLLEETTWCREIKAREEQSRLSLPKTLPMTPGNSGRGQVIPDLK